MDFHICVEHLIEIKDFHATAHRHTHGVADKVRCVMVFDERGIFTQQRALVRILDIGLERY